MRATRLLEQPHLEIRLQQPAQAPKRQSLARRKLLFKLAFCLLLVLVLVLVLTYVLVVEVVVRILPHIHPLNLVVQHTWFDVT